MNQNMNNLKKMKNTASKSKCDTNAVKDLIENGRRMKKISQRELSRKIGISHASVNDLEKGRIQKPSMEILISISEELDISISELLKVAGYEKLLFLLNNDKAKTDNE